MVLFSRGAAFALSFFVLAEGGHAFLKESLSRGLVPKKAAQKPTALSVFDFFNEGKKMVVKKLAGEYDEVAIRSRLDDLITTNPVLMLSFVE
jgi:hypothetical protein